MEKIVRVYEGGAEEDVRLDRWLQGVLAWESRSRVRTLFDEGRVRVGGKSAKAAHRLKEGEIVEAELPDPPSESQAVERIPLSILAVDDGFVVVDKPAGMVVHPGAGVDRGTLAQALLHRFGKLSGLGGPIRPGIVHRLDRGTSGVIVVARTEAAHRNLALQFESRNVRKEYLALVWGTARSHGRLEAAISRDPRKRKIMSVERSGGGKAALTSWERIKSDGTFSFVKLLPHTGRTHQLRVHMSHLGHPIVGDPVYGIRAVQGYKKKLELAHPVLAINHPLLHASKITFSHPTSGAWVTYSAPLPEDFSRVLQALRLVR